MPGTHDERSDLNFLMQTRIRSDGTYDARMRSRHARRVFPIVTVAAVGLILPGFVEAPANATPPCTTSAPVLDQQVTCTNTGAAAVDIAIPIGAHSIDVVVSGAGGGAGGADASYTGGAGGSGARIIASLDISDVSWVSVLTGAGGANGVGGGSATAGQGGGYSAIWAGPRGSQVEPIAIAGGGGGGGRALYSSGYAGGAGAGSGTGAGGDGVGGSFGSGADGTGSGGIGRCGYNGQSWAAGGNGAGGYSSGGSGFGGGGGGDVSGPAGAGGSVVASGRLGNVTYSSGGASGGTGTVGAAGLPGTDGTVTLTFREARVTVISAGPTFHLAWSGLGSGNSGLDATNGTWVATPTAAEWTRAGFTLLGWATSASFPQSMAQEATHAFDGLVNGARVIYIPAGHSTFVSGDNTLHAIWGSATPPAVRAC